MNTSAIHLTEALLALTRADQRSFTPERVDLSLIAEEAAETLQPLAEKVADTAVVKNVNVYRNPMIPPPETGGLQVQAASLTADRAWAKLDLPVRVRLIR